MIDLMRFVEKLDLDKLAAEFMEKIKISRFDLFFIASRHPASDEYDFLGMAYSLSAAREIAKKESNTLYELKIFRINFGELLLFLEKTNIVEEVRD